MQREEWRGRCRETVLCALEREEVSVIGCGLVSIDMSGKHDTDHGDCGDRGEISS